MTPRCNAARSLVLAGLVLAALPSRSPAINIWTAQDPNGANGNRWSEPLNWAAGVPIDGDDLFFGPIPDPSGTSVDDISSLSINSITFTADSQAYLIHVLRTLTIAGLGVFNDSPRIQTLTNFGSTRFANSAGAGNVHIDSMQGAVTFLNTSTASTATITNDSDSAALQFVGETSFRNSSTAADATINNVGRRGGLEPGGRLFFSDTATAANAAINNLAGTSAQLQGGQT